MHNFILYVFGIMDIDIFLIFFVKLCKVFVCLNLERELNKNRWNSIICMMILHLTLHYDHVAQPHDIGLLLRCFAVISSAIAVVRYIWLAGTHIQCLAIDAVWNTSR
jgi:hypothetical protein